MFSFNARKKQIDVCPYLRQICDVTTSVPPPADFESRSEHRYVRAIPTLICPWENDLLTNEHCAIVLTQNISDRGVGLILPFPFWAERVVIGFWLREFPEPWFFLGTPHSKTPIGGGFWLLGVKLTEHATTNYRRQLEPLIPVARQLLPPHGLGVPPDVVGAGATR